MKEAGNEGLVGQLALGCIGVINGLYSDCVGMMERIWQLLEWDYIGTTIRIHSFVPS